MVLSLLDLEQIRDSTEFFDDYTSAQTQALGETGVDLQGLINHMLSATRRIIAGDASGVGDWKDTPTASLLDLNEASGFLNDQIDQINLFLCRATGESNPIYSSTNFVTQSGCIEQAIGELDAAISGIAASGAWQQHFDVGNGQLIVSTIDAEINFTGDGKWTFNFSNPGADAVFSSSGAQIREFGFRVFDLTPVQLNPGDTVTVPNSLTYTEDADGINLRVYQNGQLLNPGSGVLVTDENFNDYREASSTTIVTNRKFKVGDTIQYHING